MFTQQERARLREALISAAHADTHIIAAAVTGSAAAGREDRWSDIDLPFCVDPDADLDQVLAGGRDACTGSTRHSITST